MKAVRAILLLSTIIFFVICSLVESADKEFDSIDQVPLIPRAVFFNNSCYALRAHACNFLSSK